MENDELCTYDMACMRAELLGEAAPNKIEFEQNLKEKLEIQQSELEIKECQMLEEESELLNRTHGKLDELNTILSSTQKKLNDFKKTACGSFSNIFRSHTVDKTDAINSENENTETSEEKSSIILEDTKLNCKQENLVTSKNSSSDINTKMTSHLDKLDSLINKAEKAEISIAAQTSQMKKYTK